MDNRMDSSLPARARTHTRSPASRRGERTAMLTAFTLLAMLAIACGPRAIAQSFATPNGGYISFSLANGASSAPITLPPGIPWHVSGNTTTLGDRGVGEVDMEHTAGYFLQWIGLNSNLTGTISQGFSATPGTQIVQIDYVGGVNLVVNSADTFVVTNTSGGTATGTVTWTSYSNAINSPTNAALGDYALYNVFNTTGATGNDNTATGYAALYFDNQGSENTATGFAALYSNTTGNQNTAFGYLALELASTANLNSAFGFGSLNENTTGSDNAAFGESTLLRNTTGYDNTALGSQTLYSNTTGYFNTAGGFQALFYNTAGFYNTATGYQALYHNTTGSKNFGDGVNALFNNTTGTNNTAFGVGALYNNTSGSFNIGEGYHGGYDLTTGSNNIDIDNVGVAGESGVMRFGTEGTQKQAFVAGIYGVPVSGNAVYVNSSGQLGVVVSSERFKTAIAPMGSQSEKLAQLRPVTFHLKTDPDGALQYGLIAEDVAQVYPDLVIRDANGRIDGVRYDELAPLLLNEAQRQQQAAAAQTAELRGQIQDLQRELAEVRTALLEMQGKDSRVARR